MTRARGLPGTALALVGSVCLGWGFWIPLKAEVAQVLIERAWHRAEAGKPSPRAWPWADTWPVARLSVPRLGTELYVLAGASGEAMAFGPAHVASTARPGSLGNIAIAGHRDTHFAFLRDLREGDALIVETRKGQRRYEVTGTRIVHESVTEVLEPSGHPELTLITCFPFGAVVPGGPLRYVVNARGRERSGV